MLKGIAVASLIATGLAAFPSRAFAFDEAAFCAEMKQAAERRRADIGTMLDQVTRMDGIAVLCGMRIVTFYKFLNIGPNALRDGWKERKQKQWDAIYCTNAAWLDAIRSGWTVSAVETFVEGTRIYIDAKCPR
jgi:hypothetical protein